MTIRTVTFEVDTVKLFDMLHKLGGDTSLIGTRIVGALLAPPDMLELIGMAVYGVEISDIPAPLLVETAS